MSSELKTVEVETTPSPDAAVIWLHGLGANGHDFEPIVPELRLPAQMGVRFIFPHAPQIPVTINNGYVMPAWYDILEMSIDRKVDRVQLEASAAAVSHLIDREIERGIDSKRIIIAGFSQGGAVGYQVALTYPKPLGGLMPMSTYFATKDSIVTSEANQTLPIMVFHGTMDPVVPEALGQQAVALLNERNYSVNYQTYPMEHTVCMEQVTEISSWLQARLAP